MAKNIELVGGIVATVTAIAGTLLFDNFVAPFIIRDYTVKVNVINLDQRAWTINKWYEKNAIITGHKDFKPVTLDPPSGAVHCHYSAGRFTDKSAGRKIPFSPKQADFKEATSVTYTFQNCEYIHEAPSYNECHPHTHQQSMYSQVLVSRYKSLPHRMPTQVRNTSLFS